MFVDRVWIQQSQEILEIAKAIGRHVALSVEVTEGTLNI
jgi:hypothetical protein